MIMHWFERFEMTTGDGAEPPKRRKGSRAPIGTTTLAQIAQVADVSEATVSRVINRKYGDLRDLRE
jgi:LacI family repressor for deo operon, udp, cdd, tsx, nupC, and nupG